MSFKLTEHQKEQVKLWAEYQDKKVAVKQGKKCPNYGAYSYIFTPLTIGMVVKVKNHITGDELDISDDFDFF